MKINNTAHLRQKLEGLVRESRIEKSDVEPLLQSPEKLRAVLVRENTFDPQTERAFDAFEGSRGPGSQGSVPTFGADVEPAITTNTGFAKQNLQALMVNEKGTKGEGAWFDNVSAPMPPLFDTGAEVSTMTVGNVAIQAQDLIDMLGKVSHQRSDWRGTGLVDIGDIIRALR